MSSGIIPASMTARERSMLRWITTVSVTFCAVAVMVTLGNSIGSVSTIPATVVSFVRVADDGANVPLPFASVSVALIVIEPSGMVARSIEPVIHEPSALIVGRVGPTVVPPPLATTSIAEFV